MKVLKGISRCRLEVREIKKKGLTIGLIPTMGYLHEGHISLARKAKEQCRKTFMSIFVNPMQFGEGEDLEKYPRDLQRDIALAEKNGVDYIFAPEDREMYGEGHNTYIEVGGITGIMCGKFRPGHFKGVATVVLKLFNIIPADKAYFGQKDFQQLAVIRKMVKDLNLDIEIVGCPIVREKDGLAMSSRNEYLTGEERKNAPTIYGTITKAEEKITTGRKDVTDIKKEAIKILEENPFIKKVDYFDIRDAETLEELKKADRGRDILIAAAATIGNTRLIDNVVIIKKK